MGVAVAIAIAARFTSTSARGAATGIWGVEVRVRPAGNAGEPRRQN